MTGPIESSFRPLVLVVDDDATTRSLVVESLEHSGYDVAHASNDIEATVFFQDRNPDIVLLDINKPTMSGFAACEGIRRLSGGKRVPLVMITGQEDMESIERAYELGATDFVTKPINYHILTNRVRYLLRASRTAEMLRRRDAELGRAQHVARFGHYKWDLDSRTITLSDAAAHVLGVDPGARRRCLDEVVERVHPADRILVRDTLEHCLDTPRSYQFEHGMVAQDSNKRFVRHEAEIDTDDAGKVRQIIGIVQDITTQRRAQERVHHLAYFDSLTDLPNRTLIKELLRNALIFAARREKCAAVLFCNVDNFKQVNDNFGYDSGDEILKAIAARLRTCVRCGVAPEQADSTAGPEAKEERLRDTVSRISGDCFVMVLTEVRRPEDTVKAVQRIQEGFARPFYVASERITLTASIGVSIFPQDASDVDTLLRNADAAMHQAKRCGHNSYQLYTGSINTRAAQRFSLESALRKALQANEFLLHFQPKIDLKRGRTLGFEALVRWNNRERGLVPPAEFIPVAEETGLIVPLGQWVLATACKQIGEWQRSFDSDLSIAVNLSARQFREPDLVESVRQELADSGIKPESLELELTESLLMEDTEHCVTLMHDVREMGARLAIDDFGTGYSSLAYLKRFPINTFKIDRTFIRDVEHDRRDGSIVSAMILMAHELGLSVVAEGVEDEAQAQLLRGLNCDAAQGYLFSRPMTVADCDVWLREQKLNEELGCATPCKADEC